MRLDEVEAVVDEFAEKLKPFGYKIDHERYEFGRYLIVRVRHSADDAVGVTHTFSAIDADRRFGFDVWMRKTLADLVDEVDVVIRHGYLKALFELAAHRKPGRTEAERRHAHD